MAAADYAEGKGDAPPELRLAFRCQQWNSLPVSGGILDQPAGLVDKMTVAINVYHGMKAYLNRDISEDKNFFQSEIYKNIVKPVLEMRTHGE